ncbi:hypothetical protein BFP72_03735 [Reichenbachiella sp. 5M10]|nr:hypothetical protein BFP72_03735 [Reichenbachiella sp. 5M10]
MAIELSAQQPNNSKLYELAIEQRLNYVDEDRDSLTSIILIEQFQGDWLEFAHAAVGGINELTQEDKNLFYSAIYYKEDEIKLFNNNPELFRLIAELDRVFTEPPTLNDSTLSLSLPTKITNYREFNANKVDKLWKKFYRKYPSTFGFFELSQVVYDGDFACFYMGHHVANLYASGDIIFMRNVNGTWEIIYQMNLWMS